MAYARGKYGVEYNSRPAGSGAGIPRGLLIGVAALVLVSFVSTRFFSKDNLPPKVAPPRAPAVPTAVPPPPAAPVVPPPPAPKPTPAPRADAAPRKPAPLPPFAAKVSAWLDSREWPGMERELLTVLRDAERQGNVPGARGAIENLMYRATVEDLKDQLVRRLGTLNTQLLFNGTNSPWTATVEVKRGDTLQRIAMEHRTTPEAIMRLNARLTDPNRLAAGQKLRLLNFPDADLVIHKQLKFADLLFKKRTFKRYDLVPRDDAAPGAYPVENASGARAADRLRTLLTRIAPADRDELRMFLAPGSRITVTAQ